MGGYLQSQLSTPPPCRDLAETSSQPAHPAQLAQPAPPAQPAQPAQPAFLNGFVKGFLTGFLKGFVKAFVNGFLDGFLNGFLNGFVNGFRKGFLNGFLPGCRRIPQGICERISDFGKGVGWTTWSKALAKLAEITQTNRDKPQSALTTRKGLEVAALPK